MTLYHWLGAEAEAAIHEERERQLLRREAPEELPDG
jgi:hypothetical protein